MKDPFLTIRIGPQDPGESDVSIHWKDAPDNVADVEWNPEDQAWTKICDGIHSLLANLGASPENGWKVEFICPSPNLIVEDITQQEYWDRNSE